MPQRYKRELLSSFGEVDAFIGRISLNQNSLKRYPLVPGHFAYLKISEGCNHNCSFCVIPKIKGRHQSRNIDSILKEVRRLDKEGKSEINIIGQDITLYGLDIYKKLYLAQLLKEIVKSLKNIRWIRLLYLQPGHLTADLIEIIASQPRICKYVDLPIQHINSRILGAMNRKITKERIVRLLACLRKEIPGVAIRTSLIVGFPGESEKEFKELIDFIGEQKFQRVGVFRYSREEGTPAYNYVNQVSERIKSERFDIIMRLQQEISRQLNERFLNKVVEVLIDERSSANTYIGRLAIDAPEVDGSVYVRSPKILKPGEFRKVRITDTYEYDLAGQLV